MESQPLNPEFRNNPETFTHATSKEIVWFSLISGLCCFLFRGYW